MKQYWKYLKLALIGLLLLVWVYSLTVEPTLPESTNRNHAWQIDKDFTIIDK